MNSKIALNYMFIFDPAETWSSTDELEGTFKQFFSKIGLQAEIVETEDSIAGNPSTRILLIRKLAESEVSNPVVKEKDVKSKR